MNARAASGVWLGMATAVSVCFTPTMSFAQGGPPGLQRKPEPVVSIVTPADKTVVAGGPISVRAIVSYEVGAPDTIRVFVNNTQDTAFAFSVTPVAGTTDIFQVDLTGIDLADATPGAHNEIAVYARRGGQAAGADRTTVVVAAPPPPTVISLNDIVSIVTPADKSVVPVAPVILRAIVWDRNGAPDSFRVFVNSTEDTGFTAAATPLVGSTELFQIDISGIDLADITPGAHNEIAIFAQNDGNPLGSDRTTVIVASPPPPLVGGSFGDVVPTETASRPLPFWLVNQGLSPHEDFSQYFFANVGATPQNLTIQFRNRDGTPAVGVQLTASPVVGPNFTTALDGTGSITFTAIPPGAMVGIQMPPTTFTSPFIAFGSGTITRTSTTAGDTGLIQAVGFRQMFPTGFAPGANRNDSSIPINSGMPF